ncbi:MAG: MFS transporter [Chloroflexi bacterium]|nr:MFS transporter [Chloroflexota bacterium]
MPLDQASAAPRHADRRKWAVLIAIGTGTFMSALDISVVNTILPTVSRYFHSDVASVEWVVIIYLLLVSGLLLSFGRLGDLRGHKPVYIAGFFIFIASSVLCGVAPSVNALVGARALQSLGAAMLSANSPAILTNSFPASQRGQALGLQATMTYLGLVVGPSLGGWLTDLFGWQSVFYINVPVGLLALLLSVRFIQPDAPRARREPFDWLGAATFLIGLGALLLGLNRGHDWGWLSAPTLLLLAFALALLAAFVWMETRVPAPVLDLSLFRNRAFSISIASAVLNYICVYSITFLLPFYLIQGRSLSASQAGLLLSAQPLVMALVAPVSGALSDRIGVRTPATLGMGILALGLFLLSRLGTASPLQSVALSLAVSGLGIAIFISPNNSALLGAAPQHRRGIASGLLATARNVGMVLGVGLAGAIFTTILSSSAAGLSESLFAGVRASLAVVSGVALLGMFISSIRFGETDL